MEQHRYAGGLELFSPFNAIESILLTTTLTDYRHDEIEETGEVATTSDNESWDSRLEIITHTDSNWYSAMGLHYPDREFSADGEEAFIQPVDQQRLGILALGKLETSSWGIEFGARLDRDEYDAAIDRNKDYSSLSLSLDAINYMTSEKSRMELFRASLIILIQIGLLLHRPQK